MKLIINYKRKIFETKVFTLIKKEVVFPDGRKGKFDAVEHRGSVAIVPLLHNKEIILIKQIRPTIEREIYEIPAGTLEKGETPSSCARRELIEETGFRAGQIRKIGELYLAPGYSTEKIHIFLSRVSRSLPNKTKLDRDEYIKPITMPLCQAMSMVWDGKILDAKTVVGLLFVWGQYGRK